MLRRQFLVSSLHKNVLLHIGAFMQNVLSISNSYVLQWANYYAHEKVFVLVDLVNDVAHVFTFFVVSMIA
jgi:hypothetical protein